MYAILACVLPARDVWYFYKYSRSSRAKAVVSKTAKPMPEIPGKSQRAACHEARDAFFVCIAAAGDDDATGCKALRQVYDSTCPVAWVKHFDKKRIYQEHKAKLNATGYAKLSEVGK
eukprot:gene13381-4233_t